MSDLVSLITEIVILISAIVGVYKVATSKAELPGSPAKSGKREWPEMVKMIGAYFGVYVFMFVPMIFILVFTWFTKMINRANAPEIPQSVAVSIRPAFDSSHLTERGVLSYNLYLAGTSLGSASERDNVLSKAVDLGVQSTEFRVALAAAQSISAAYTKDQQLRLVMRAAIKAGALEIAVASIQSMAGASEKDSAGLEFAAAVENWNNHLQSKHQ